MNRRTPFGSMLSNFRFQKAQAIAKVTREMRLRNKADNPKDSHKYEIRETARHSQDGATTVLIELWQKIDSEHVKISTSVDVEILKDDKVEAKKDDDWGI